MIDIGRKFRDELDLKVYRCLFHSVSRCSFLYDLQTHNTLHDLSFLKQGYNLSVKICYNPYLCKKKSLEDHEKNWTTYNLKAPVDLQHLPSIIL